MKKKWILFIVIACMVVTMTACAIAKSGEARTDRRYRRNRKAFREYETNAPEEAKTPNEGYNLLWSDEFDGQSLICPNGI